jgi:hypothetical protein
MYEEKRRKLESEITSVLNERRAHERIADISDCWAVVDDTGKSDIKDISLGGICLKSLEQQVRGSLHEIRLFTEEGEAVTATGTVVRSEAILSESDTIVYESAFAFTPENRKTRDRLAKLLHRVSE